MRGAHYALLGVMVLSCATEQTDAPLGGGGNMAGAGPQAGSGGSAAGVGGGAAAGSGMTSGGGGAAGGVPGSAGTLGSAGTFGTAGAMGGMPAGGGGAGGMGGVGGTGGGNGGTAGKANGGAGGKAMGGAAGMAGAGGNPAVKCGDNAIRAKTQWTASASDECAPTCTDPNGPFTAALAIDADVGTRFATGKKQAGGEWLQVDLGAVGTVNRVTLNTTSATDYTRHYQVRVSNTSGDMAGQVLADGDGATGTSTINLSKTVNGRYVLISQTGNVGAATSWWSVNDLTISCQ